jgi:Zn-dependent protease
VGGAVVSLLYVLTKLKFVLLFASKFGTLLSMLVSVGFYALIYPWQFAAGLVGMIFVHEMGHYAVARQQGVKAGLPVFIPFVGAFIGLKQQPHDARQEAIIAIAGPLVGSVAAFATLLLGQAQGGTRFGHLLIALAQVGFIINLFNLIPVSPLDGGRVLSLLSKYFSLGGLLILVALLFLVNFNPLLLLIIAVGGWSTWQRFRGRAESAEYYAVPARDKAIIGLIYFGLLAALGLSLITEGMHPKPFVNLS